MGESSPADRRWAGGTGRQALVRRGAVLAAPVRSAIGVVCERQTEIGEANGRSWAIPLRFFKQK